MEKTITEKFQAVKLERRMTARACYIGARLVGAGLAIGSVVGALAVWAIMRQG